MPHIITSPHPDIDIPDCTLPQLLLGSGGSSSNHAGPSPSSTRASQPIFYPSPISPRVKADGSADNSNQAKLGAKDSHASGHGGLGRLKDITVEQLTHSLPGNSSNGTADVHGGDHTHSHGGLAKLKDITKEQIVQSLPGHHHHQQDAANEHGSDEAGVPLDFNAAAPLSLPQIRELAERVGVSLLSRSDWAPRSVVAFFSANQHDYCAIVLGVQLAGGIAALCNPSYKPRELAHQLRMTRAKIIVATTDTQAAAAEAGRLASARDGEDRDNDGETLEPLPASPPIYVFDEAHPSSLARTLLRPPSSAWARKEELLGAVRTDPARDAATYCFSSGTSGLPKALALTHRNFVANILQFKTLMGAQFEAPLAADDGSTPSASQFHVDILPTSHAYGLLAQLVALYTGTPRVVLARFKLDLFLQVVQDHKATFAFVVPPILLALAKSPEVDKYDLSSMQRVASGAASLPLELARRVKERLGIDVTDGYGMSEMSPIVCLQNVQDAREAPDSVGFLAPNTKARILGPDGEDLGPDQEGELLVQGPQMMAGYVGNDEGNAAAFTARRDDADCWLRTGDVAKASKEGRLTLTGRTKDIIKMHGFQVSPRELEDLLFKQPGIADAAVVGVKDKDAAEAPWAFLVAAKDADGTEQERTERVLDAINKQVAGYKRIKGVTWVEALPKSDSGKVLKRELKRPE